MAFLKEMFAILLLLTGVILVTAGLTGDNIGKFKSWFGLIVGSVFVAVAMWLG